MSHHIQNYLDNIGKPWGVLFYRIVWTQIGDIEGLNIIDFGSGFGITADSYGSKNNVVAIEPNIEMTNLRITNNQYTQKIGGLEKLYEIEDNSIDYIICHNVLEYADERASIVKEFVRVLKLGGKLSIVKHNHAGRIMQKVVFENNCEEAMNLLNGEGVSVLNFGEVKYYENEDLINWGKELTIKEFYGVRTFWALQQNNDIKEQQIWQDNMFRIEKRVSEMNQFREISFYHHLILEKERI